MAVNKRKKSEVPREKGVGICLKCGTKNPESSKYCNNCGLRLRLISGRYEGYDGLFSLHLVAALYSLLSVTFNSSIQQSDTLLIPYLTTGILGLYLAYAFGTTKIKKWTKFLTIVTVATGLFGTIMMFLLLYPIGPSIIAPSWIIFLITAWKLGKDWHKF